MYVNRAASLKDAKWIIRCVLGHSGQRISVKSAMISLRYINTANTVETHYQFVIFLQSQMPANKNKKWIQKHPAHRGNKLLKDIKGKVSKRVPARFVIRGFRGSRPKLNCTLISHANFTSKLIVSNNAGNSIGPLYFMPNVPMG